ncbi:hypothetical protein TRIUR3_31796 [Triticum urartu]|uniref:Uncharacterized protein n=1 Tax=Triticum urartu TaxID=4572 RepID=M7ZMK0_TRIUA|nr:hypothetical protein TRIUR3_31796 [Triticum urartu]
MAPNGDAAVAAAEAVPMGRPRQQQKPRRISMEGLQRAMSDLALEFTKKAAVLDAAARLPAVRRVRERYCGRWVCGLCAAAVTDEADRSRSTTEEALAAHIAVCGRFNRLGRANPVLMQTEAMREIFRKRGKSNSPRDGANAGGLARSSSCMSAITKDLNCTIKK